MYNSNSNSFVSDTAEPVETGTCDAKTCGDKGVAAKENKASTLPACAQPMGHLGEMIRHALLYCNYYAELQFEFSK